jgi:hypothetical protein
MKILIIFSIAFIIYLGIGFFLGWIVSSVWGDNPTFGDLVKFALQWPLYFVR